ncbi:MAG: hypothetical protein AB7G47_16975 [Mycolicibacterium sp.]|uniref:hypothetical protein n=1 Tax=Mycolicibacterium sp. TaxID=2320850 RepID=UPI003D0EB9AC
MHSLRSATGVLVLSTALLVASTSGAIAAADTGDSASGSSTSSAASSDNESNADNQSSSASTASATASDVSDLALSAEEESTQSPVDVGDAAPADTDESTAVAEESEAAAEADALADPEATGSQSDEGAPSGSDEPKAVEAAPKPASASRDDGTVAAFTAMQTAKSESSLTPSATVATPRSMSAGQDMQAGMPKTDSLIASASTPLPAYQPFVTMVNNMQTAVVSLGNAAVAIPPALWALTYSQTPFTDAIALLQSVLNSVTQSATAMAQLPGNFVALLGVPTVGTDAVLSGIANPTSDHRMMPVMDARSAAAIPALAPLFLQQAAPAQQIGGVAGYSALAAGTPNALAAALSAPIQVVPTSIPALAGEYDSIFDRAFGALLVPLSLWALATGALPGLVGLLVVFGAGARVGYRQAKAGFALKVSGIARFAGPGPLGVVRTGSFITLHQGRIRSGGTGIARWSLLGDQAA